MDTILKHIDNLLGSSETSADKPGRATWTISTQKSGGHIDDEDLWEESETVNADSVLALFARQGVSSRPTSTISYFSDLHRKSDSDHLVQSLLQILSSIRTNDEISNELTELLGFDEIETIVKILDNRYAVVEELSANRASETTVTPPNRHGDASLAKGAFSYQGAQERMQQQFRENASRPLFSGIAEAAPEVLPHVYSSSSMAQGSVLSQFGSKYMLPMGTAREMHEAYEEVTIPPANPVPPKETERLIPISELDDIVKGSLSGYTSLNRIQSIVYPTAYGSNENLLICAPTGAGKTDVAMLTILRVLDQHRLPSNPMFQTSHPRQTIDRNAFKIIYVAPMKALAAEIVRKLGKRLQWLAIEVRELTGDMQMTKVEIAKTQIIVTTPEKWDVVTRKPTGEGEIASSIKLLIIDEIHLLNEERGAVIETIVARTLRQVESSQSMIRIVGLSATLPNYRDVAEFLRKPSVSRYKGLFYFDASFRPIPLEQHFLGIKGKAGSAQSRKNFDDVTFQKVSQLVAEGHQVMVFVHARKETVKSAMALRDMTVLEGVTENFSCEDHPQFSFFRQRIGMLRSDRNLMEKMFAERAIKVLCCTATLAWGVNLPAHAVVIKGTQVYDSSKGKFVDLSVLDVLQIFGRAGRPGMETSGEGYICTTEDKLTHYLDAVTSQIPIESQFQAGMIDSLNAEIALGTVSTTRDAVQWLGYTYLFVRMRMNPFVYGITGDAVQDDPRLGGKRNELVAQASRTLAATKMVTYDSTNGQYRITELGRIAARYYIRYQSVEIFNREFRPRMSEADVLGMLSQSTEFDQIQVRENEIKELEEIMARVPCEVKGGTDTSVGKVNILLQGFISREIVEDFALVSDMAYAAQNGGRIARALLEIAISKKWANVTSVLMGISKAIETRLWPFDHPLKQFPLKPDTLYALEKWADDISVSQIADLDAAAMGKLVRLNEAHGQAIVNAAKQFPTVHITCNLQPIASDVLKICLKVKRAFEWNTKAHGTSEPFWLWVEDQDGSNILQLSHITFYQTTDVLRVDFFIPTPDGQPPEFVTVKAISDRWVGAEEAISIPLGSIIMPAISRPHTSVLNLPFLNIADVGGPSIFQDVFSHRLYTLNTLQTQSFWNVVCARHNSLLCAPAASGKTTLAEMAIWFDLLRSTEGWILVVLPTKVAAIEMLSELQHGSRLSGIPVQSTLTKHHILSSTSSRTIRVVTAKELFDAISTRIPNVSGLRLVVCDGLEQLDPTFELAISLLRIATQTSPTRFIGMSSSLTDPESLAMWLDVGEFGTTSFKPQDRDQSLVTSRQTFSIPHSASLFKAMARPAHRAIQDAHSGGSALVFVPSRGQCRAIAQDIITRCTLEEEHGRGYVPDVISGVVLEDYCSRLQDSTLMDFVSKGVGFFHSGIGREDRGLMISMFTDGIIRVMVVPKDSCWSVPVRARTVIVMGTQYVHIEEQGASRQVRDYSLAEVVRMQSRAIQQSDTGHFHLFCQAEAQETYSKFLKDGLPLESQLHESRVLSDWLKSTIPENLDKQRIIDLLSFTFLAQRVATNPSYYGYTSGNQVENLSAAVDRLVEDIQGKVP
ncbi:unnamed protein product [Cyclocybe aegerita]|uniref:Activating signal cointegrator 1 complex subunit 3 n=1 Tax=Cyclocybe aegerita TaxID=1973307 RepID=A0A8S0VQG5_CYCAE|nr:unnamed protein product [Cyclocybe aegerita]